MPSNNRKRDRGRRRARRQYERNRAIVNDYKAAHPCVICGEGRPPCLDFHHVNPEDKLFEVNNHKACGLDKLYAELDKCVVLCSNCHRLFHAGWVELPEGVGDQVRGEGTPSVVQLSML